MRIGDRRQISTKGLINSTPSQLWYLCCTFQYLFSGTRTRSALKQASSLVPSSRTSLSDLSDSIWELVNPGLRHAHLVHTPTSLHLASPSVSQDHPAQTCILLGVGDGLDSSHNLRVADRPRNPVYLLQKERKKISLGTGCPRSMEDVGLQLIFYCPG